MNEHNSSYRPACYTYFSGADDLEKGKIPNFEDGNELFESLYFVIRDANRNAQQGIRYFDIDTEQGNALWCLDQNIAYCWEAMCYLMKNFTIKIEKKKIDF